MSLWVTWHKCIYRCFTLWWLQYFLAEMHNIYIKNLELYKWPDYQNIHTSSNERICSRITSVFFTRCRYLFTLGWGKLSVLINCLSPYNDILLDYASLMLIVYKYDPLSFGNVLDSRRFGYQRNAYRKFIHVSNNQITYYL